MNRNDRAHRCEAAQTRASNQPHQKSLSLIGHGVANSNSVATCLVSNVEQELIPDLSRNFLDSTAGSFGRSENID